MANTYTQIQIHFVFVVQFREALISPVWEEELYKYIISIIQKYDHKVLAIGGVADHVHILIGMRPVQCLSVLAQEVKRDSAAWINKRHLTVKRFNWQKGFGAFSYSASHIEGVMRYIRNQKKHHQKKNFLEEYRKILNDNMVVYDERYIFHQVLATP